MANTLNEVPERIDRMLGNYRKVAMGTLNIDMPVNRGDSSTYTIKTNANFKIENAIVFLQDLSRDREPIGIDLKKYQTPKVIFLGDYYRRRVSLKIQNINQIVLKVEAEDYSTIKHFIISNWIIIG